MGNDVSVLDVCTAIQNSRPSVRKGASEKRDRCRKEIVLRNSLAPALRTPRSWGRLQGVTTGRA